MRDSRARDSGPSPRPREPGGSGTGRSPGSVTTTPLPGPIAPAPRLASFPSRRPNWTSHGKKDSGPRKLPAASIRGRGRSTSPSRRSAAAGSRSRCAGTDGTAGRGTALRPPQPRSARPPSLPSNLLQSWFKVSTALSGRTPRRPRAPPNGGPVCRGPHWARTSAWPPGRPRAPLRGGPRAQQTARGLALPPRPEISLRPATPARAGARFPFAETRADFAGAGT